MSLSFTFEPDILGIASFVEYLLLEGRHRIVFFCRSNRLILLLPWLPPLLLIETHKVGPLKWRKR